MARLRPVFVGDPGRSGTTVVRECLASHPEIHGLSDEPRVIVVPGGLLDMLNTFIMDWDPWRGDEALHRFVQLCMAVDGLHGDRLRAWAMKTFVTGRTNATRGDVGRSVMLETEPLGERADAVAYEGLEQCFGVATGRAVVDDTPYSCCVTDLIGAVFPDAVTVAVVRHPADTLSSMQRKRWAPDDWDLCAARIKHTLSRCHHCDVLLRLEDVVRSPARLSLVLEELGLEYVDACARPLSADKLHERRRDSLPAEAWAAYEKQGLKEIAEELGY